VATARDAKRRLDHPLTNAHKSKKVCCERRSVAGWVKGSSSHATLKSTRRKHHPLKSDELVEKDRVEAERRSVVKLKVGQKFEKVRV